MPMNRAGVLSGGKSDGLDPLRIYIIYIYIQYIIL